MIAPEIRHFLNLAEESHEVAKTLLDLGHNRFSAAQSYYTIFYLAEAMLLSKGFTFSSHSAVIAAYGKVFAKTGLLDSKFHRYMIDAQERCEIEHYGDEGEEVTYE
jgi:uncharacterized protein (UPF0332 family)